jgi:ABC-type oligopeptide transport system ATPase subunit
LKWFEGLRKSGAPNADETEAVYQPAGAAGGFDATSDLDVLGRTPVADHAYALLTDLPIEWSVRVGLLGEWGSGKSTIADWLIKRAEADGHVVVAFKPWAASSVDDLWFEFAEALVKAFQARSIDLPLAKKLAGLRAYRFLSGGVKAAATMNSLADGGAQAIDNILTSSGMMRISREDIEKISVALQDKRVIVIIDDLDRTDPAILPKSLLALRDLLDIPRFSFLLPFDEGVVANALKAYNLAWGDGAAFIDKILDFRVRLAAPDTKARWLLFSNEITRHCPFIPLSALESVSEHLPANARRLKAVARNLRAFKREANRHRKDEIDWISIVYALMLRSESETFFTVIEPHVRGQNSKTVSALFGRRARDTDPFAEAIEALAIEHFKDAETRSWAIRVCLSWRDGSSYSDLQRIIYSLDLLSKSDAVTWLEYDRLFADWSVNRENLAAGLETYASAANAPVAAVVQTLARSAIQQYDTTLKRSFMTFTPAEWADMCALARLQLHFAEDLIIESNLETADVANLAVSMFELVAAIAETFSEPPQDIESATLRNAELALARRLFNECTEAQASISARLEALVADRRHFDRTAPVLIALQQEFGGAPSADLVSLFRKPGAMTLHMLGNEISTSRLIYDPRSSAWAGGECSTMTKLCAEARSDSHVHHNFYAVLEDIAGMARVGANGLEAEFAALVASPDILGQIWSAALAQEVQPRRWRLAETYRTNLVAKGVSASDLPDPVWANRSPPSDLTTDILQ